MKEYKKSNRYYYFRKQKLLGVALLAIGIFVAIIDRGNITALLLLAIPGLSAIFSKDMMIYDDYYYEMKAKEFDKWPEP